MTTTRSTHEPEHAQTGERAQARAWLQQEWDAGRNPSGAAVGRAFGKGARWGQQVAAETRARTNGTTYPDRAHARLGHGWAHADGTTALAPETAPADLEPSAAHEPTPHAHADAQPQPEQAPQDEPARAAAERTAPRTITRLDLAALGMVAAVAAVLSFAHQWHLATLAGEGALAWLLPLSVDGMVAVASRTMLARRRAGARARLATCALIAGVCASVTANIWGADPTPAGWAVAAWPPLAYLVAYELLLQQLHPAGGEGK